MPARDRRVAGADRHRRAARATASRRCTGKRVGLVTNHTGRARDGATTIDLLYGAKDVKLVALFSPEHGIRGIARRQGRRRRRTRRPACRSTRSTARRAGRPRRCSKASTRSSIDLQDIGARFYTYMTTMAYVLEEAAKRKLPVVVLDRPNPINGFQIEGPALDKAQLGFTGYFAPMPIRHGMTIGELARLFNGENKIGADLTVVAAKNWQRDAWFDETALPWINPSPNMRNLIQATLYPGIGAIETTNLSVGRGTDTPFEQIGAPWIDGAALAEALNARRIPGVAVLSGALHADVEQVRGRGVPGRVHDRDRPRGAAPGAARRRDCGDAPQVVRERRSSSMRPNGCSARGKESPGSAPARIRRRSPPHGAPAEARWRLLRTPYLLYR